LLGKAPFGVALRAKQKGIKVIGLAGQVPLEKNDAIQAYFDVLMPIGHAPLKLEAAMQYTAQNLVRTARELGNAMELKT
jgi:glycerate kinase